MKKIVKNILWVLSLMVIVWSCDSENDLDNLGVTEVKSLYMPDDNHYVELESSPSASLLFEWEQGKAEDGGLVMYEIAFDVEGGDFSKPVYKMASDNNGVDNKATVSHKTLNQVAQWAGIESAATGKLAWTVYSSKGINEKMALEERTIEVTRLAGFADIPTDVFITGEGTEPGTELENAMQFKAVADGEFEIYTKLTGGEPYYLVDKTSDPHRTFKIDGQVVSEDEAASQVSETSVYRIYLDFNIGAVTMSKVNKLELFFAPADDYLFELPYNGNGVFKAEDQPITFREEDWGRDERYKFKMTMETSDGIEEQWWGSENSDNSRPSDATPDSFYDLYPIEETRWDYCFKFREEIDMSISDVIVYFTAEGNYTHEVIKKGDQ